MKKLALSGLIILILSTIQYGCKATRDRVILHVWIKKIKINNKLVCKKGCIVFVGDSNVELTNWQEYFKKNACNYGMRGSTSGDVYNRRERIYRLKPDIIVMLVGGNDLIKHKEINEIVGNYRKLIEFYKTFCNKIYCISNMPVDNKIYIKNNTLKLLNRNLEKTCRSIDATFVNVYPYLYHEFGLNPKYAMDAVHLNKAGQDVVVSILKKYLKIN